MQIQLRRAHSVLPGFCALLRLVLVSSIPSLAAEKARILAQQTLDAEQAPPRLEMPQLDFPLGGGGL